MESNVSGAGSASGRPVIPASDEPSGENAGAPSARRRDERFEIGAADRAQTSFATRARTADAGIDERYLAGLEEKIAAAYPADGSYLETAYQKPPHLARPENFKAGASPYNPLHLRLPLRLESYLSLYDARKIGFRGERHDDHRLSKQTAVTTHLELAKHHNVAYVDMLRAANGSEQALSRLKAAFIEGKIFDAAGIYKACLKHGEDQRLLQAMLGHLSLDILRSPEREITTAARIGALEILRDHFDVDSIAKAVADPTESGIVHYRDHTNDLIAQTFLTDPADRNLPHTQLFWANKKIIEIFAAREDDGWKIDVKKGVAELSRRFRKETVQMTIGLLRYEHSSVDGASAFRALIGLTELDESTKQRIFGDYASYRNGGVSRDSSSADDCDVDEGDINRMTPQQVVALVRRLASERDTTR